NTDIKIAVAVGHAHHKVHDVSRNISDTRQNHENFRVPNDSLPELEPRSLLAIEFSARPPRGEFRFDGECDEDAHYPCSDSALKGGPTKQSTGFLRLRSAQVPAGYDGNRTG